LSLEWHTRATTYPAHEALGTLAEASQMAINSRPLVPMPHTSADGQRAGAVSPPKRNPGHLIIPLLAPSGPTRDGNSRQPYQHQPEETTLRPPGAITPADHSVARTVMVDMSAAGETGPSSISSAFSAIGPSAASWVGSRSVSAALPPGAEVSAD